MAAQEHGFGKSIHGYKWELLSSTSIQDQSKSLLAGTTTTSQISTTPIKKLAILVPGRLLIGLKSMFGRKQKYFASDLGYGTFRRREELHPVLSSILIFQGSFANDVVVRSTVEALTFTDPGIWQLYMKENDSPEEVLIALNPSWRDSRDLTKSVLIAGLFKVVAYLSEFRSLIEGPGRFTVRDDTPSDDDLPNMLRWVKEICLWRVNFVRRDCRKRFLELATIAATHVEETRATPEKPSGQTPDTFVSELTRLIDFWTGDVEMEIAGRVGA